MSICSDVIISKEEARQKVKRMLLYQQENLIDAALMGMSEDDLTMYLNQDADLYFYHIEDEQ